MIKEIKNIDNIVIKQLMKEHGIKTCRALAKALQIVETDINKMLNGQKRFTKWHKSTMFYYFKSLELEKQIESLQKNKVDGRIIELNEQLEEVKKEIKLLKQM